MNRRALLKLGALAPLAPKALMAAPPLTGIAAWLPSGFFAVEVFRVDGSSAGLYTAFRWRDQFGVEHRSAPVST